MKKIIAVFLAALMLLTLAACGGTEDPGNDSGSIYDVYDHTPAHENKDVIDETQIALLDAKDVDWKDKSRNSTGLESRFIDYPYYTEREGTEEPDMGVYAANAMYNFYTDIRDEKEPENYVWAFGTEPSFWQWVADITFWTTNDSRKSTLRNYVIDRPITADGYIWSWNNSPHWPDIYGDENKVYHYDNNPRYVTTVYTIMSWEQSTALLDEQDTHTVVITDANEEEHVAEDVSQGMTVRQKVDAAMQYMLKEQKGEEGLLILTDPFNSGRYGGHSSNYWDNHPYGYKDPYENILFYQSLQAMAGIENMLGNSSEAQKYLTLAETVKANFNREFWDENKLRFITTIDADGIRHDYGMTYLNTEAIASGIVDSEEKVRNIYSWLTGNRIIASDTSTGDDIYYWGFAPRANTKAIESGCVTVDGEEQFWWNSPVSVRKNAGYGNQLENGGAILYTAYYDITARTELGADFSFNRYLGLVNEFAEDQLYRDPMNRYGDAWILGCVGEFAENGLVGTLYFHTYLGINADWESLVIDPSLPSAYTKMGVKDVTYGTALYKNIEVTQDGTLSMSLSSGAFSGKVKFTDFASKNSATATFYDSRGNVTGSVALQAQDGVFVLDLNGKTGSRLVLE